MGVPLACALYRDQYSEILMKKWVEIFNGIFDDDDYMPLVVETDAEYRAVIAEFPYEDKALQSVCCLHRCENNSGINTVSLLLNLSSEYFVLTLYF